MHDRTLTNPDPEPAALYLTVEEYDAFVANARRAALGLPLLPLPRRVATVLEPAQLAPRPAQHPPLLDWTAEC